jgi:hypothetical protein
MKKRILTVVFLLFFCLAFNAQTDSVYYGTPAKKDSTFKPKKPKDSDWKKKFTYGGNTQLYFSPLFTIVDLSPAIGYKLTENLNLGVGFIYSYSSANYRSYGRYMQSAYGPYCYARYSFLESFFVQGQFDRLRQTNIYNFNDPTQKVWVDYAWLGGGYRRSLGNNMALMSSIMVNVIPNRLSIYPRTILQFGFVGDF